MRTSWLTRGSSAHRINPSGNAKRKTSPVGSPMGGAGDNSLAINAGDGVQPRDKGGNPFHQDSEASPFTVEDVPSSLFQLPPSISPAVGPTRSLRLNPFHKSAVLSGSTTVKEERAVESGEAKLEAAGLLHDGMMMGMLHCESRSELNDGTVKLKKSVRRRKETPATLANRTFTWGSREILYIEEIVALTYSEGSRRFTVHAFPKEKLLLRKRRRQRRDVHFLAPNSLEAHRWAAAFADLGCFIHLTPRSEEHEDFSDSSLGYDALLPIKVKRSPSVMVIINPKSGHGRGKRVFEESVCSIFELAGFKLKVVETKCPRHAKELVSSADLEDCQDGIICVGGDGIVSEVVNGLFSRTDEEAKAVPIGIIPAGSDNSLCWTVLGIRDPESAALAIIKGGTVPVDAFAMTWGKTGMMYMGLTMAYYGFMSDVLQLSAKYHKRFGPLRYAIAGAQCLLKMRDYDVDVEFLPMAGSSEGVTEEVAPKDSNNMHAAKAMLDTLWPVLEEEQQRETTVATTARSPAGGDRNSCSDVSMALGKFIEEREEEEEDEEGEGEGEEAGSKTQAPAAPASGGKLVAIAGVVGGWTVGSSTAGYDRLRSSDKAAANSSSSKRLGAGELLLASSSPRTSAAARHGSFGSSPARLSSARGSPLPSPGRLRVEEEPVMRQLSFDADETGMPNSSSSPFSSPARAGGTPTPAPLLAAHSPLGLAGRGGGGVASSPSPLPLSMTTSVTHRRTDTFGLHVVGEQSPGSHTTAAEAAASPMMVPAAKKTSPASVTRRPRGGMWAVAARAGGGGGGGGAEGAQGRGPGRAAAVCMPCVPCGSWRPLPDEATTAAAASSSVGGADTSSSTTTSGRGPSLPWPLGAVEKTAGRDHVHDHDDDDNDPDRKKEHRPRSTRQVLQAMMMMRAAGVGLCGGGSTGTDTVHRDPSLPLPAPPFRAEDLHHVPPTALLAATASSSSPSPSPVSSSSPATHPRWVRKEGPFLCVMACNHRCKSVQCLASQELAPYADKDDGGLDLLLVKRVSRVQLIRFLLLVQFGRHISLPFVEYMKTSAVRLIPRDFQHRACGVDGELLPLEEPVTTSVVSTKCRLMGQPPMAS